jgi:hypothetical protein
VNPLNFELDSRVITRNAQAGQGYWQCLKDNEPMNVRSISFLLIVATATSVTHASRRLTLTVTETVGVRRDASPVHVRLKLPEPVPVGTRFRLLADEKLLAAQFRPDGPANTADWWLDFIGQSAPFESRQYVIEYGDDVTPSPEPSRGHRLIRREKDFVVSNAPHIDWTVPSDFRGFLHSVDFTPSEHLRPDSLGFSVRDRDGRTHRLGGDRTMARVIRDGRLAVALQFTGRCADAALQDVSWTADLVFPGPVSWVDVQLRLDDPSNCIEKMSLQLKLNLDQPTRRSRTLVDLGAGRTIYRSLTAGGEVELRADHRTQPLWQILREQHGQLQPFAIAARDAEFVEGWAHVMDRQRCLAIAFDQFGQQGAERINIQADGTLTASKSFSGKEPKTWRTWLHFVHFPPRQSASTDRT